MKSPDAEAGLRLARAGRFTEALPLLERALLGGASDPQLLATVAGLLQQLGPGSGAARIHGHVAGVIPDDPGLLTRWADALLVAGETPPAIDLLERACRTTPDFFAPGGMLAALLRRLDEADLACEVLAALASRLPVHPDLLRLRSAALVEAERLPEAQAVLETLAALRPSDPYAHVELGRLAVGFGDAVAARVHFKAAMTADAHSAAALWELAQVDGWRLEPQARDHIESLCRSERDPKALAGLHATLARCRDREGDSIGAARHAGIAKSLMASADPGQRRYEPAAHRAEIDATRRDCTPEFLQRLRGTGNPDPRPVFVVGLPRSGTTLLERMLASHPAIAGIGEQPFAVQALRRALHESGGSMASLVPSAVGEAAAWHLRAIEDRLQRLALDRSARRIVDKMPDNYLLAGWLRSAFPRATIIHCLRDPRDVALSCWLTQFAGVSWSFSLDHIAQRIEQHRRLMRHWRTLLQDGFVEVRYADLVAEPESVLRGVLAAMETAWHPQVLDFAAREGFVASASRQQVREPLHDRSIGRWRNYEATLRPVLPRLEAIAAADEVEVQTSLATRADRSSHAMPSGVAHGS